MAEMLLVRFGELSLKGKNRQFFVRRLVKNIREALAEEDAPVERLEQQRHRLSLHFKSELELRRAVPVLQRVFGISSLSPVEPVGPTIGEIETAVKRYAGKMSLPKQTTFRISVQRLSKSFPLTSIELERNLGALVQKETGWKVKLTAHDVALHLEIDKAVALFTEKIPGAGGLPVGAEGKVLCLTGRSQARDFLAAYACLKRGCEIGLVTVGKSRQPAALEKALRRFAYGSTPGSYSVSDTSELPALTKRLCARGIATGASAEAYPELPENLFILAPLVGMSESEVRKEARRLSSQS